MKNLPRRQAFALVLVMITIVLAATMAVFFLGSAGRERRGVDLYARAGQVRHLAGMTVNRVIGQISAATKEGTASVPVSWASQPGMVRTYGQDGNPKSVYKLYSWDNLYEAGADFVATSASELPPSGWKASPAAFTDLNQAVNGIYPIVDPSAVGKVDGFTIDSSNVAVAGSGAAAPMPVKWLYVLEDGQMVAPSSASGSTATIPGATTTNPIVGRVAFWTDDETSKVNINTASEGSFWDWPKAATYSEMQFAGNPPVGGEFNRVPGHPAMTSLSAVFPELDPGDRWADTTTYRSKTKDLLGMTPRVPYSDLSSRGGTYPVQTLNFDYGPVGGGPQPASPIPSVPLTLKTDRLFVSPDELYFTATNRIASTLVTTDMLSQRAFFLTSNSRAPETTLFETPRVSVWPITWPYATTHAQLPNRQTAAVSSPNPDTTLLSSNTWMRAEERLLAFTASLNVTGSSGGDRYFFQRQNDESPTYDYANIQRNKQLLSYLQHETALDVPGYGSNYVAKLGAANRDLVLANAFNSVRSLVNQYTFSNDGKLLYSYTPVAFAAFTRPSGVVSASYVESGAFNPIPLKLDLGSGDITTTSEFPLLREAALVFHATDRVIPTKKAGSALNYNDPMNWDNLINVGGASSVYPNAGARTTQMRATMILDFYNLRGSTRNNQPVFWVKLGSGSLKANGVDLGFAGAVAKVDFRAIGNIGKKMPSYMLPFYTKDATTGAINGIKTLNNGDINDSNYGLISIPVTMDPTKEKFTFAGDSMTVEIYGIKDGNPSLDPTADPNLRVATYTVNFSDYNGQQWIPLAPRWNYFDKMNSLKSDATDSKSSMCPNPGFNTSGTASTKWAAIEIAPAYRTPNAVSDPALGGNSSIPGFTSLYATGTDGSITYPPNTGASAFVYGITPTYAFCDSAGTGNRIMTDYRKRLSYYTCIDNGAATYTVYSLAENSNYPLNPDTNGSPNSPFNPGGFPITTIYDTVLSVTPDPSGPGGGDPRLATKFNFKAVNQVMSATSKMKQILGAEYANHTKQYHTLGAANNFPSGTGYISSRIYSVLGDGLAPNGMATSGFNSANGVLGRGGGDTTTAQTDASAVGVMSSVPDSSIGANVSVGDWSSGAGYTMDGGLLPRTDQDFQSLYPTGASSSTAFTYITPYFVTNNSASDGANTPSSKGYFSPNRQIPSPITLLGSLPASTTGWRTLLFSPNPSIGSSHPGLSGLPDYLFLDLFWMPVAEPYPISEEFSTAGKINLNYKIMPFPYINRKTGMYALLKSTWLTALNTSMAADYKAHFLARAEANSQTRYSIDTAETLKLFDSTVFDSGNIFRSAAQVCAMWMVPQGSSSSTVQSFWNDKLLTSDTAREQPYDHIYSRVTTKSNTFMVHWRVQVLRKQPHSVAGIWDETTDKMASELRGSTLVERFLDPNRTDIPDYATDFTAKPLSNFYKWRTISENYFQP
ncbi:hypothetical protein BH09VER1_BH09VER1_12880 [soil metagenome]